VTWYIYEKRVQAVFLEDIIKSCEYVQEFVEGIDFDQFMIDNNRQSGFSDS